MAPQALAPQAAAPQAPQAQGEIFSDEGLNPQALTPQDAASGNFSCVHVGKHVRIFWVGRKGYIYRGEMNGPSPPLELFRPRNKPEIACESEPAKVALNHPGVLSSGTTWLYDG